MVAILPLKVIDCIYWLQNGLTPHFPVKGSSAALSIARLPEGLGLLGGDTAARSLVVASGETVLASGAGAAGGVSGGASMVATSCRSSSLRWAFAKVL